MIRTGSFVRGQGRLVGPSRVDVGGEVIEARRAELLDHQDQTDVMARLYPD
jgi:hypothetical protein